MSITSLLAELVPTAISTGNHLLDKWSELDDIAIQGSLKKDLAILKVSQSFIISLSEDHAEFIGKLYLAAVTEEKIMEAAIGYRRLFLDVYANHCRGCPCTPSLLEVEDDHFSMYNLKQYARLQAARSITPNANRLIKNHYHKS